jgi:hypothetical protein
MTAREEVAKALQGYILSVEQKAVLGRFRDTIFMRSGAHQKQLKVEQIDPETLHAMWQDFRAEALR